MKQVTQEFVTALDIWALGTNGCAPLPLSYDLSANRPSWNGSRNCAMSQDPDKRAFCTINASLASEGKASVLG